MNELEIGWMAGILDGEGAIVLVQGSYIRKSDGRKPISPRVLMAVCDFEILYKYTSILSHWGIHYTYVTQIKHLTGDWSPKINVNVHRLGDVVSLLEIVLPHLSLKKTRAELVISLAQWKLQHGYDLQHRYSSLDPQLLNDEYEFWTKYREIYAGRGNKLRRSRERSILEATLQNDVPIHFSD